MPPSFSAETHRRITFGLGDDMREFVAEPINEVLLLQEPAVTLPVSFVNAES